MKIFGLSPFTLVISLATLTIAGHFLSGTRDTPKILPNPRKGGWSRKKIAEYNRKMGTKLKHGVDYDPITLEDFKRKGSWAVRHYKRKDSWQNLNMAPLMNDKGELLKILKSGADKANEIANKTLAEAYSALGLIAHG